MKAFFWISVGALWLASAANAQTFTPANGKPGLYGIPYGWVGPQGSHVWEEYRKSTSPGAYGPVTVSDQGSGLLTFDSLRQQSAIGITPGTFIGTARSLSSPPQAAMRLYPATYIQEIRIGFAEHLSAGGGASIANWVSNRQGDNGSLDPYFGDWDVDDIFLNARFVIESGKWSILFFTSPQLHPAGEAGTQQNVIPASQILINLPPRPGSGYYTDLDGTQPIALQWDIRQVGTNSFFEGTIEGIPFSWLFDDGATRFGLTDPQQPDGTQFQRRKRPRRARDS